VGAPPAELTPARAIQACLNNEKDQGQCSVAVKDLYECCAAMWLEHARTGKPPGDVKDDVCPLPPGMRQAFSREV
jgi:hypothetical protein